MGDKKLTVTCTALHSARPQLGESSPVEGDVLGSVMKAMLKELQRAKSTRERKNNRALTPTNLLWCQVYFSVNFYLIQNGHLVFLVETSHEEFSIGNSSVKLFQFDSGSPGCLFHDVLIPSRHRLPKQADRHCCYVRDGRNTRCETTELGALT